MLIYKFYFKKNLLVKIFFHNFCVINKILIFFNDSFDFFMFEIWAKKNIIYGEVGCKMLQNHCEVDNTSNTDMAFDVVCPSRTWLTISIKTRRSSAAQHLPKYPAVHTNIWLDFCSLSSYSLLTQNLIGPWLGTRSSPIDVHHRFVPHV